MLLRRSLASIVATVSLAASLLGCAGYERAKRSDFATLAVATVRFASASGITANLQISDSAYRGVLGASAGCGQDFNGCYSLAGGTAGGQGLCPGEWYLGTQALLFDTADVTCGGAAIASCTLGASSGNVQTFSPGANAVSVVCTSNGADVNFDVTLCDGPGCATCTPTTCQERGKNCGTMTDGCGTTLNCGACSGAQTCGGAGVTNVCGTCTLTSCAAAGKNCGTMSDGCGATLSCGACSGAQTCGGAGVTNVCGTCPNSCTSLNKNCGTLNNGCGGTLNCGACTGTDICTANVCRACVPRTCAQLGKNCGTVSDGCGVPLSCGVCSSDQVCGASTANVCAPFSPSAFDVDAAGAVITAGYGGQNVFVKCFNPDGSVKKATFPIASLTPAVYNLSLAVTVSVARSRAAGVSTVTWHVFNASYPQTNDWQNWLAMLDADCNVVSGPTRLDLATPGIHRPAKLAVADDGRAALYYESEGGHRLVFFAGTGALISSAWVGERVCYGGGLGYSLGMNRATGDVVAACESQSKRYFQRFTRDASPVEASMVEVPEATVVAGYWGNFEVAANDDGRFIFLARPSNSGADLPWVANFYDATGGLLTSEQVGHGTNGMGNQLLTTSAGDFVLAAGGTGFVRSRYTADGRLVSTSAQGGRIRLDGSDIVYTLNSGLVLKNPFAL